jgi:hypothetical protein
MEEAFGQWHINADDILSSLIPELCRWLRPSSRFVDLDNHSRCPRRLESSHRPPKAGLEWFMDGTTGDDARSTSSINRVSEVDISPRPSMGRAWLTTRPKYFTYQY